LGLLVAVGTTASADGSKGRTLYKWVDDQGVTHYGDRIPPEYASQEQHIINSQGVEINRLDAQKSADQIAQEEQKRQAAEERESRDRNLLNTYVTVQEIERLRDQRLNLVTDQIKVTNQFLDTLNGRMKKLRVTSMRFRPYSTDEKAPPMPDQVAEDLVRLQNDIHTQEQNLSQKRGEEATMRKQFEGDIERFKELKHLQ
jgi:sensor c-di-GMP phosphodiesterase-like protein